MELHNRAVIRTLKTHVKRVAAATEGTIEQLQQEYNLAAKKLDKAAAKKIIHPNLAARKKSQLARLANAKKAQGTAPAPANGVNDRTTDPSPNRSTSTSGWPLPIVPTTISARPSPS